jgi:hypothetical protein
MRFEGGKSRDVWSPVRIRSALASCNLMRISLIVIAETAAW